ncbi:MAG: hypothetical protein HKN73_15630 [Gemmatimonadetes bacterium]|nr:hypothetical protein [Gemmatimonadota bacterium]
MNRPWMDPDVLIVGGGPSGSTLATLMARRGWTVVLVDRASLPRPKPCGEFLSPGALRAMERLRIHVSAPGTGRLTGWVLQADGVEVATRFAPQALGASMPRDRLDAGLLAHARREGVQVLERSTYLLGAPGAGAPGVVGPPSADVQIRTPSGHRTLRPTVLVGAGGLRCPVSRVLRRRTSTRVPRKISLTGHVRGIACDPRFGRLFVRGDLTVGLAPSDEAGRLWNATVVVPRHRGGELRGAGATQFFFDCLARAQVPAHGALGLEEDQPMASSGFRKVSGRTYRGRTVLVGDAQGYFDPFTGQGIYQALRSAELLAPSLHLALAGRISWGHALGGYSRRLARERGRTHRLQRAVEAWLMSGVLRPPTAWILSRASPLFGAIMEATTDRSSLSRAVRHHVRATLSEAASVRSDPSPLTHHLERKASHP